MPNYHPHGLSFTKTRVTLFRVGPLKLLPTTVSLPHHSLGLKLIYKRRNPYLSFRSYLKSQFRQIIYMMTSSNGNNFLHYWPFVQGIHRWPVNSPHKDQWRGALIFSLICAWINGWISNRETSNFRRHRAHNDVTVMLLQLANRSNLYTNNTLEIWNIFRKKDTVPQTFHWLWHLSYIFTCYVNFVSCPRAHSTLYFT